MFDFLGDYAKHLVRPNKRYSLTADGISADQEHWHEARRIHKATKISKGVSMKENTSKKAAESIKEDPDWLQELSPILEMYWETGEFPDDLDSAWFDRMIELT